MPIFFRDAGAKKSGIWPVLCLAVCQSIGLSAEQPLPQFDFTQKPDQRGWRALHDIAGMQPTAEGFEVIISGADPYLSGPARDFPPDQSVWAIIRLKSDHGGMGQLFHFRDGPREADSVRFPVPPGEWYEARLPLPALGNGCRFRIDPPGAKGVCLLGALRFERRIRFSPPEWPKPAAPAIGTDAFELRSGELTLRHDRSGIGRFEIEIAGQLMAVGNSAPMIGCQDGSSLKWLRLPNTSTSLRRNENGFTVAARHVDPDGAVWQIRNTFTAASVAGTIEVDVDVTVDQDRAVVYLPLFTLFPGLGTFGTNKVQALFAGLEYLDNEPGSSEADLIGPASQRQVPDTLKITFPLMAITAEGRCLGLAWEPDQDISAVFDSPDRLFDSNAHVMGLMFPGSNGTDREEGNLLPYGARRIPANHPLKLRAFITGERGASVIPAVRSYVKRNGLPPLPDSGYSPREYYQLASAGWLDSRIREGSLFRHAVWTGFGAQPAADAPFYMEWLAAHVEHTRLESRLRQAASEALTRVTEGNYNFASVGHIQFPVAALLYGGVKENAEHARRAARELLQRFAPDGSLSYTPRPGGVDYGKTHFASDANGHTARSVLSLLEYAAVAGDAELIAAGLRLLQALDKFGNTVPRGAQTWEIALHTPDILASAWLVRAYQLGYELTGQRAYLDQALYWAWTGVPFVYLHAPTSQPIGLYSTIPVLGATQWKAPIWIGLPVQWCGLVYADALYRLAMYDPAGPWKQIADGITVSGIQQSWPLADPERRGLLPDIFQLRSQLRDGPAINPGTLLAPAIRLLSATELYDFKAFRDCGLLVHAPGRIKVLDQRSDAVQFRVEGWSAKPWRVLINGVAERPVVRVNGKDVALQFPHEFAPDHRRLILVLSEPNPAIEIGGQ